MQTTGEWLIYQVGVLQTMVSEGQKQAHEGRLALHRRIDDTRRELLTHIRRLDKKSGATSTDIPHIKYMLLIAAFLIVGTLGNLAPGAMKATVIELMKRVLLGGISGG